MFYIRRVFYIRPVPLHMLEVDAGQVAKCDLYLAWSSCIRRFGGIFGKKEIKKLEQTRRLDTSGGV